MSADIWRNHPGLSGQDGIGIRNADGSGTQWFSRSRAEQIIAELADGLRQLDEGAER